MLGSGAAHGRQSPFRASLVRDALAEVLVLALEADGVRSEAAVFVLWARPLDSESRPTAAPPPATIRSTELAKDVFLLVFTE